MMNVTQVLLRVWLVAICLVAIGPAMAQQPLTEQALSQQKIWQVGIQVFQNGRELRNDQYKYIDNLSELVSRYQKGESVFTVSLSAGMSGKQADWKLLRQCPTIQSVIISTPVNASLDSLFAALQSLPNLQRLSIGSVSFSMNNPRKQLLRLPESFKDFPALRAVTLQGGSFDFDQIFSQLIHVSSLRELQLNPWLSEPVSLPDSFGKLTQLTQLAIDGAVWLQLPPSAGGMSNLKHLRLNGALPGDKFLSEVLPNLVGLESLDIEFAKSDMVRSPIEVRNGVLQQVPPDSRVSSSFTFPSLQRLTKLRTLTLTGNKTKIIFPTTGFTGLTQLESLKIKGFRVLEPISGFCALSGLKTLIITKTHLSALPTCLDQLVHLETLEAEDDSLTTLPVALFGLPQLRQLSLKENPLQTLPAAIGQLKKLKTLNLTDTKLASLPASIGQLKQLEELEIKSNQLTELPAEMGNLTNLRGLNVFDNQLVALPSVLTRLTQLRSLVVLGNRLTQLPADLGKLRLLHTLIIDQNALTSLPESIGALDSLQRLFIGENQLAYLPESLTRLRNLKELYVGQNKLTTLPASIGSLKKLESFHFADNPILELPVSVGEWQGIKTVYIQNTKLRLLPTTIGNWTAVTMMNIENSDLLTLPREIGQCTNLERLTIKQANVFGLPEAIGRLTKLTELIVTGKVNELKNGMGMGEMQKLPDSLVYCRNLRTIRVNNQREFDVRDLWQHFPEMPRLFELDLTNCGLTELPASPYQTVALQRFVLTSNRLTRLLAEIGAMPYLRWLDLTDNPLPPGLSQPFSNMDQVVLLMAEQDLSTGANAVSNAILTRAYLASGSQKNDQSDWVGAIAMFEKALSLAPDSLKAIGYGLRADALMEQKKYADAVVDYEKAISMAPLLPAFSTNGFATSTVFLPKHYLANWWGRKGLAQGELGNTGMALPDIQKALGILPEQGSDYTKGTLLLAQGRLLALKNQTKEALMSFGKALDLYDGTDMLIEQTNSRSQRFTSGNELTAAGLALLTGQYERAKKALERFEKRPGQQLNRMGLIGDYLSLCYGILTGTHNQTQALATMNNYLRNKQEPVLSWGFNWFDATLLALNLPKEQKDALIQLTALAKSQIKKSE